MKPIISHRFSYDPNGITEGDMIDFSTGDILAADVEAVVNTVNCVGIMGRGIALQFKNTYPENFSRYEAACASGIVQPGRMFVFETGRLTNPRFIINFPTKRHWRGKSRMEDVESGLKALREEIQVRAITSIAIPPLGSGLGGLDWADVRPRIEQAVADLPNTRIVIYEPRGAPTAKEMSASSKVPNMTPGRASLVVLMHQYLSGLMDPFVSLLEIHKLMYFMQEAGESLNLKYAKATYGPYAENLRHVLRAVEGHLISGYADGGDAPDKQLELVPGAVAEAGALLTSATETRNRFDRVSELVEGYETPFGLELLATVHWVATRDGAASAEEALFATYAWGERKRRFNPAQVERAYATLQARGWLATAPAPV